MTDQPAALLHEWLRVHAPVTFETLTARPDARGIWMLSGLRDLIPPMWEPMTPEFSAEQRAWLVELGERSPHPDDPDGPAGTPSAGFRRPFVPIASNGSGDVLYVDERPGPESGCVCQWWHDDYLWAKLWPSVDVMLTDVLRALETGGVVLGKYRAQVLDGEVDWQHVG
ncbi:SMI1/KNR4 family protein [Lentzea sp. NPDC058450]|uniref:SMI1/KNR4 family protein n=1 Tax=Lentzea sp. NPDC058450 TaxID=3346505 RepID=UPI00364CE2EE